MSDPPKKICEVAQAYYVVALDSRDADSLYRRWQTCTDEQAFEMLGACVFNSITEARDNREDRITGPWRIFEYQSREVR